MFRSQLVDIFTSSSFCPIRSIDDSPLKIFRIERHGFKTAIFPFESRVAYRVICDTNTERVETVYFDSSGQPKSDCGPSSNERPNSSDSSGVGLDDDKDAPSKSSTNAPADDVVLVDSQNSSRRDSLEGKPKNYIGVPTTVRFDYQSF